MCVLESQGRCERCSHYLISKGMWHHFHCTLLAEIVTKVFPARLYSFPLGDPNKKTDTFSSYLPLILKSLFYSIYKENGRDIVLFLETKRETMKKGVLTSHYTNTGERGVLIK